MKKTWYVMSVMLICLSVFTFMDLNISFLLYQPGTQSPLIKFLELFGHAPLGFIGSFSAAAFIVTIDKEDAYRRSKSIFSWVVFIFTIFLSIHLLNKHIKLDQLSTSIVFALHVVVSWYLANAVPERYHYQLRQAAIVGLLLAWFAYYFVTNVKEFWGRQRFNTMSNPYLDFSPWYLPGVFTKDDAYMSFPSGHAAYGSVLIWITLLPIFVKKLRGKETFLTLLTMLWVIPVMLSRVIMGAHFATDVIIGMSVSVGVFAVLKKQFIIEKMMEKENVQIKP